MFDIDLEEVFAPLHIAFELLSINECVLNLGLSNKMHELILSIDEILFKAITSVIGIDKILVCIEYLITFKHSSFSFIFILLWRKD